MLAHLFAVAIGCFCLEKLLPGWRLPAVRTWPVRVVLVNLVQLGVVLLAGVTWERWLSSRSVFELSQHVSPLAGVFAVVAVGLALGSWAAIGFEGIADYPDLLRRLSALSGSMRRRSKR